MAHMLRRHEYCAYALRGGLDAWVAAGLPTDSKSAERGRTVPDVCPDCHGAMTAHVGHQPGS
jgi:hypothetical protein